MEDWTQDWIIGVCNTSGEGIAFFRFYGTKEEVAKKLLAMVEEDKEVAEEWGNWDYGTESIDEIYDNYSYYKQLYAYGVYHDYHIDYCAVPFNEMEFTA